MIDANLLKVGEELTCELKQKGEIHTATLTVDGLIEYKGSDFSPSKWVGRLYGTSQNGWKNITARGKTLDYFREQLNSAAESQLSTDFGNAVFEGDAGSEPVPQDESSGILPPRAIGPIDANLEEKGLQSELRRLELQIANQRFEIQSLNSKIESLMLAPSESASESNIVEKLRERLLKLSPDEFERLVGEYLKAKGFSSVEVTQRSHDGGIDGHCEIPFIGVKVVFQAKRYTSNTIGIGPVQRLQGSITGRFDLGIFITTSDYTPGAREYVENPTVRITLVNGERLLNDLTELGLGVRIATVVKHEVDEEFFADLENL